MADPITCQQKTVVTVYGICIPSFMYVERMPKPDFVKKAPQLFYWGGNGRNNQPTDVYGIILTSHELTDIPVGRIGVPEVGNIEKQLWNGIMQTPELRHISQDYCDRSKPSIWLIIEES